MGRSLRGARVASTEPMRISANEMTTAAVMRSPSTAAPRATATAGLTYVITVARTGPTSAISLKYSTNARAVQTTASPASAPSTWADGMTRGQVSAAAGA